MSKKVRIDPRAGINSMYERRLLPDSFVRAADNVDLRYGAMRPHRGAKFIQAANDGDISIFEYRGRTITANEDREYTAEILGNLEVIYYSHAVDQPRKIVNGQDFELGQDAPISIPLVAKTDLVTPTGVTATFTTSGGLPAGAYSYRVGAYTSYGRIVASLPVVLNTTAVGGVVVKWGALAASYIEGYIVYGRSTGGEAVMAVLPGRGNSSWTDDGSLTPSTPFAAAYDQAFSYRYIYTYTRNCNGMIDESGPSALSPDFSTAAARQVTRDVVNDGLLEDAVHISPGLVSGWLAEQDAFQGVLTAHTLVSGLLYLTYSQPHYLTEGDLVYKMPAGISPLVPNPYLSYPVTLPDVGSGYDPVYTFIIAAPDLATGEAYWPMRALIRTAAPLTVSVGQMVYIEEHTFPPPTEQPIGVSGIWTVFMLPAYAAQSFTFKMTRPLRVANGSQMPMTFGDAWVLDPSKSCYTYWNLYRTGDTVGFNLVQQIPISDLSFVDYLSVDQLGPLIPTYYQQGPYTVIYAPPPEGMRSIISHNGMKFGIERNSVRWSDQGFPDAWPQQFFERFDHPPLAIISFAGGVIVLCEDGIYRLDGYTPTTIRKTLTMAETGCIAPYSVQLVDNRMIYLSRRGLMAFDGNYSHPISEDRIDPRAFTSPSTNLPQNARPQFFMVPTEASFFFAVFADKDIARIDETQVLARDSNPSQVNNYAVRSFVWNNRYFMYYRWPGLSTPIAPNYDRHTMVCVDFGQPQTPITTLCFKPVDVHVTKAGRVLALMPDVLPPFVPNVYVSTLGATQNVLRVAGAVPSPDPFPLTTTAAGGYMDMGPDGLLYMSDDLHRVVKINITTGVSTVFVPAPAINTQVMDLKWCADGNLYILYAQSASPFNGYVEKVTPAGVASTVFSKLMDGTSGNFNAPTSLEVNADASVFYIGDILDHVVYSVTASGTVTVFAGHYKVSGNADGTGTAASLSQPYGLAWISDYSALICSDLANANVRKITVPGAIVTTLAGVSNGAPVTGDTDGTGTAVRLHNPSAIRRESDTLFYFADDANKKVKTINPSTGAVVTVGSAYTANTAGVCVTPILPATHAYEDRNTIYSKYLIAESQFGADMSGLFGPADDTGRDIYEMFVGEPLPIYTRIPLAAGDPSDRKLYRHVELHGHGTGFARLWVDNRMVAEGYLNLTEDAKFPRKMNFPQRQGQKGYYAELEVIGRLDIALVELSIAASTSPS